MELQSCFAQIVRRPHHSSSILAFCLLLATALTLVSTNASAQLGVLDESKEIVKGSTPPQSTDPGKSFTIDSRSVVAEPGKPDQPMDMSKKALRLRETGTRIRVDSSLESGRTLTLSSEGLGRIDKDRAGTQAADQNSLTRYLESNDEIFEGLHQLTFIVEEFIPGDQRIIFRQLIGDTPLELVSYLNTDEGGNVIAASVHVANPDHQEFDPRGWLSENVLLDLAEKVWAEKSVRNPFSPEYTGFVISFDPEKRAYVPVYRLYVGIYEIKINAITGDTMSFTDTASYEKRCTKTLSGIPPLGSDCAQKNSSNQSWFETFWDSVCIGTSPFCENENYNEVANEILNLRTWINAQGPPNVTTSYDLRLNTPIENQPSDGGMIHFLGALAYPVITIGPWATLFAADYIRKDIAAHEMGHLWHRRANPNYTVVRVTPTGKAFSEAVADTVRAFQTDNYVQYTSGTHRDLNPDTSLKWGDRIVTEGTFYDDSRVISNLFIDIREVIGKPKAVSLFRYIAANTNQDSDADANDGIFTITDLKAEFTQCVASSCGLTSSQKSQVCSIWTANEFPGAICPPPPPPPPPPKPAWISAVNTGNCGWGYSPTQGYFWGSIYYFNWSDVVGETYWQFCNSSAPFGPYTCTDTYGANTTTTLPNQWVVSGTWYAAVKACNSGGCSDLTGTGFHSTPNCSL